MAGEARRSGHAADAAEVFERARRGEGWADTIVSQSAFRVATLCRDIQMMLDPAQIVIGGGIGLADGYLARIGGHLSDIAPRFAPNLVAAKLGSRAGIIGAADLAGEAR
jgi:N-acetylmannosamine-6-phosphate 2-epimerase/N-acetylmannosamine kinase